jgi:The ARF-like 2 binding protein BART
MKSEKKSSTLDGVSESEKLEIFLNYMASDEWVLPVQSFIDYYCVVFATEEYHEHQDEKQRVYQEYKQIVSGNLNIFLHSGLGISQNELAVLLGLY